ncbi:MAG TPA: DNA repair protein RadA [Acidobacteriota bacterium]|nr:DNA repair protein RadA [Acidobacteriota bacterium]
MPSTRSKTLYVCQACGSSSPKWVGRCPGCGEWNTMVEEEETSSVSLPVAGPAVPYQDIEHQEGLRVKTGNSEFDRVLGGGIVPGSLVLLGGEPGIGKSTLLLQIAEALSEMQCKVLYVAGEESVQQVRLRGERIGIKGSNLFLSSETCLERTFEEAGRLRPDVLVVDSIQTVFTQKLGSVPGSIGQIRECTGQLMVFAKREQITTFLIGHITKDGSLAGPKALEHLVDTVLYFEGDRHQNQKIIRAVKNRFGPANELGFFQMTGQGLTCVENASRLFLSERPAQVPGSVVLCSLEGTRPVLVEIQALVSDGSYGTGRRTANGVDPNRVALLLAMLDKRVGLHLLGSDVFVNVAGGLTLTEPAIDLALVMAIISSFRNRPISQATVVFGEVGLAGEVRAVNLADRRVKEAAMLGFERVVLPKSNLPLPSPATSVKVTGCSSVHECLDWLDSRG